MILYTYFDSFAFKGSDKIFEPDRITLKFATCNRQNALFVRYDDRFGWPITSTFWTPAY